MSIYGKERSHEYADLTIPFVYSGYYPSFTAAYFKPEWNTTKSTTCAIWSRMRRCCEWKQQVALLFVLSSSILSAAYLDIINLLQDAVWRLNGMGRNRMMEPWHISRSGGYCGSVKKDHKDGHLYIHAGQSLGTWQVSEKGKVWLQQHSYLIPVLST